MNYLMYLFVFAIALTACEKSSDLNCDAVEYGITFEAKKGDQFCFPDGMKVTIDSLVNQFCPCDATCIWAGEMLVYTNVELANGNELEYIFHSARQDTTLDLQAFRMESFDIEFETDCDNENPVPAIESAELRVNKE